MKKICRTIKLRKYKSFVNKEILDKIDGYEYIVCFDDNTYKSCLGKMELRECLEKIILKVLDIYSILWTEL